MTHGIDTGFLVAAEVVEHSAHTDARSTLGRLIAAGELIAIAPQVLAEFIHIVTDSRRFSSPLDVDAQHHLCELLGSYHGYTVTVIIRSRLTGVVNIEHAIE